MPYANGVDIDVWHKTKLKKKFFYLPLNLIFVVGDTTTVTHTLKPRYNGPRYSEFRDIVN